MFWHRLCAAAVTGALVLPLPALGAAVQSSSLADSAASSPVSGQPVPGQSVSGQPAKSSAPVSRRSAASSVTRGAQGKTPVAATYTMGEAVRLALEANPNVESSQSYLEGAESGRKAARSGFGPSVSSSYGMTHYNKERPTRGTDRNSYTWSVTASQPLFTGFNLLNTYQKASLQRDNQALQLENTRLSIAGQVQTQFLAYLKAQENIRSTERSLDRARAQLALAQASYNVGQRPRLDVLQAELDVSRTQATLIQSENARELCRAQLNTLLNLPVNAPADYVGNLDLVPFSRTLEQCLELAFKQRPDLLMAQKAVAIAEKDLGITRSSFYPQLAANLTWNTTGKDPKAAGGTYSTKDYSQWQAGITATWNLFNSGKRWHTTQQAQSQISALHAQLQSSFNNSAYEVKAYLLNAQDAKRTVSVAERSVASAQESYNDAKMRYELQLGTNLDLLTAQSALATAELSLISARADYLTALSRLYIAIGEIHPDLQQ